MSETHLKVISVVLRNPWKSILAGLFCFNAVVQCKRYFKFVKKYGKPDYIFLVGPMTIPGFLSRKGTRLNWALRSTLYASKKKEFISIVPILWGTPMFYTNSLEVMRQTVGSGTNIGWQKPDWINVVTSYWGQNVLTVDGPEWRRHRRVIQPAFNSETFANGEYRYDLVWKETTRLYNDLLISEAWPTASGQTISLPVVQRVTTRLALSVILSVGFGLPSPWNEQVRMNDGKLTVAEVLALHRDNSVLVRIAPWLFNIPGRFRKIRDQLETLREWFKVAIAEKKATIDAAIQGTTDEDIERKMKKKDVFSRIVLASQQDQKNFLEDSEIIGNTWIMMFAGHETTANSLAATLAFLAIHRREQSIVYEEISQVMEKNGTRELDIGTYEDLIKTRSAFLETLRITEPVYNSQQGKDGVIEKDIPIEAGQEVVTDMIGLHVNPRYFPEPLAFKPSRWYDATSDEAYTTFAIGPRVCIGRKFALVEAVCFLANLLRDWEVLPDLKEGETVEQWKNRTVDRPWFKITLGIADAPLIFKRR